MEKFNYIATGNYRQDGRNETAHAMKNGEHWAIGKAAEEMAKYIPSNAVLVPIPSHTGNATYTLELAQRIARKTTAEVVDALKCEPREMIYNLKKQGRKPTPKQMGFYLVRSIPENKRIIILDNVVATGTTAAAALMAIGRGVVFAYAAATNSEQIKGLNRLTTTNL